MLCRVTSLRDVQTTERWCIYLVTSVRIQGFEMWVQHGEAVMQSELTPQTPCGGIHSGHVFMHAVRRGVDIGQVVLHQSTGVAALQWVPTGLSSINDGVPIDALSAADALAAKQLMRSTLLSISETIHASLAGTPPHMALHTSLAFWALLPGGCVMLQINLQPPYDVEPRRSSAGAVNC